MVVFHSLGQLPRANQGMQQGDLVCGAAGNGVATEAPPRTSFGGLRLVTQIRLLERTVPSGTAHGTLAVRDRHAMLVTGTERKTGEESNSGVPNNPASGPTRPALDVVHRQETWQIGTDHASAEDNNGPFQVTHVRGGLAADGKTKVGQRRYPLGTQGDPWSHVYGGTPGLYRPYGDRGHVIGPPVGSNLDGPQMIKGGRPHGRHSPTVPSTVDTMQGYRGRVQMKGVRSNRPANSKIAGQSYSQTVVHEGGTRPNPMPTSSNLARRPGLNARWSR